MTNKKVETLLKRIESLRNDLAQIGDMRPGSLTRQFHKRGDKKWPYWQISYTLNKKSKTEYVSDQFLAQIRDEISEYKKFKELVEKLVELSIALSKERIKFQKGNIKS